jgi:predicted dehydrogenase
MSRKLLPLSGQKRRRPADKVTHYARAVKATPIGVVGYGNWGRHIVRDLIALGAAVTVVARDETTGLAALDAGAARVVGAVDDLPDDLEGLVVATPTATHAEVTEQLIPYGVPIYVEKPLTCDAAAARHLAELAPDRLFVMHKWRYHPGIELLGEIARSGELGPVVGLRTVRVGWGNPHPDVDGVWILVPHDLSIALEILGEIPEPRSAVAEIVGGKWAGIVGLLGDEPWFALESSTAHPIERREIRLVCRDGVATLSDSYADHVLVTRGQPDGGTRDEETRPISTEFPLLRELRAFLEHLDGGPPPKSSAAEAVADVNAVELLRDLALSTR